MHEFEVCQITKICSTTKGISIVYTHLWHLYAIWYLNHTSATSTLLLQYLTYTFIHNSWVIVPKWVWYFTWSCYVAISRLWRMVLLPNSGHLPDSPFSLTCIIMYKPCWGCQPCVLHRFLDRVPWVYLLVVNRQAQWSMNALYKHMQLLTSWNSGLIIRPLLLSDL